MKRIAFPNMAAKRYPIRGGGYFELVPGQISGFLALERFLVPNICDEEAGLIKSRFAFRASDNKTYRNTCIWYPELLWIPPERTAKTWMPGSAAPDITIRTVIDSRDAYAVKLDAGGEIVGRFKYTEVSYDIHTCEAYLLVKNRFHVGSESGSDLVANGYATVQYEIPYDKLLWRKATKLLKEDIALEGEDFVDVSALDEHLYLEPSPINFP